MYCAVSRLAAQSRDWHTISDSENAQHNLEIAQISRCGCPSSCLASFMNTQSQWHSSVTLLVESTLMGHFWLLCSFHSSVHDVNTWTTHTVDFRVFFTMIGFLAASISSLEIVASKMLCRFLSVWCWQSRALHVSNKVSSGSWERPWALPKLVAKAGLQETQSYLYSTQISNSNNQKCSWWHCNFFVQWHIMTSSSQYILYEP